MAVGETKELVESDFFATRQRIQISWISPDLSPIAFDRFGESAQRCVLPTEFRCIPLLVLDQKRRETSGHIERELPSEYAQSARKLLALGFPA